MSTVYQFVTTLPVTIERKKIETQLDSNAHLLKATLLPIVTDALDFLPKDKFKNPELNKRTDQFYRMTGLSKRDGFVASLVQVGNEVASTAVSLYKQSKNQLPTTIARDNITYKQVAYLQASIAVEDFVDYFSSIINYFLIVETTYVTKENPSDYMNRATIQDIEDNWIRFCELAKLFASDREELAKNISQAADNPVEVDSDVGISQVHGSTKVNPVKQAFIPTRYNPFYAIGMAYVRHLSNRHKILEEKTKLFETLLVHHQQIASDSEDPQVLRRVEELTEIVEQLRADLAKSEARYG